MDSSKKNIIEDRISFKYYKDHNHDFVENTKNYGCLHNDIKYGAGMTALEISIIFFKDNSLNIIANKVFKSENVNFKKILEQFVEYCANRKEYFDRMKSYKTERQFKIYTDSEYQNEIKYLYEHISKSKADVFRDMKFKCKNEIYHMSVNVNICKQMDYCCEIVPEEDLDNWYFVLKLFPIYEDKNDEDYKKRCKKISKLSYEELLKRYKKENHKKESSRRHLQSGTKKSPYKRSEVVSELAKRRAKGICELSSNDGKYHNAPFYVDGSPYLESHHVKWLSHGGDDSLDNVLALCPNCHRKIHMLCEESDNKKLCDRLRMYSSKLNKI